MAGRRALENVVSKASVGAVLAGRAGLISRPRQEVFV